MRLAILMMALLGAGVGGCVVDVGPLHCREGFDACHDDVIEECIDDEWVVIDDCFERCRGTCVYVDHDPMCTC